MTVKFVKLHVVVARGNEMGVCVPYLTDLVHFTDKLWQQLHSNHDVMGQHTLHTSHINDDYSLTHVVVIVLHIQTTSHDNHFTSITHWVHCNQPTALRLMPPMYHAYNYNIFTLTNITIASSAQNSYYTQETRRSAHAKRAWNMGHWMHAAKVQNSTFSLSHWSSSVHCFWKL